MKAETERYSSAYAAKHPGLDYPARVKAVQAELFGERSTRQVKAKSRPRTQPSLERRAPRKAKGKRRRGKGVAFRCAFVWPWVCLWAFAILLLAQV